MKKERQDETQFTTKIGWKTSLGPSYFGWENFHSQLRIWWPIMPKLAVLAPLLCNFMDNSITFKLYNFLHPYITNYLSTHILQLIVNHN
jgi:hypothetical protein